MMQAKSRPASDVCAMFTPMPQVLRNVRFRPDGVDPLTTDAVTAAIREGEARLAGSGRVLIRKSGTEPLIRVMAEGEDQALVQSLVNSIADEVAAV